MELALAELAPEEPQEVEEDIDFVIDKGICFSSPLYYALLAQVTFDALPLR